MDLDTTNFNYGSHNIKVSGSKRDHIFKIIKKTNKWYESRLLEEIKTLTKDKPGIFIDAGANIGNHSLFFAKECNSTKVLSFEPDQYISDILRINTKQNNLNEKIKIIQKGLYSKECYLEKIIDNKNNLGATEFQESSKDTGVFAITLDSLNIKNKVSCFKLDIQNLEIYALRGSKETIEKWHPIIIAEAMNKEHFREMNELLSEFGYTLHYHPKRKYWGRTPTYIWL